ncbi:PITH domain-containing protein [Sphaceloma murrayae]|uniref:PITH domain-containing protein n=1 Tax=Sphaceloma murrayae TaxID=2082308 RepID=A0A2K1R1E5_9PEZI|nr:PITH domain-containing protein [Sphaceloma murrayae]
MSHCHSEHSGHGHDHEHDHAHGAHDHSDDITPALQNHIYQQIDFSAITTLNEAVSQSGSAICQKTWNDRLDPEPELCSDADEQLLMHIPFAAQIRLHSMFIRTSPSSSAPQTLKVFVNREDLDFGTAAEIQPTQTFSLSQTSEVQEVPVKRALFNTVRSLDLFFEDNWSNGEEDETMISYIGFKGEWMNLSREPVNFLYEAAANPNDHQMVAGVKGELGSRLGGAGGRDGM